jgi:hypothetical protein
MKKFKTNQVNQENKFSLQSPHFPRKINPYENTKETTLKLSSPCFSFSNNLTKSENHFQFQKETSSKVKVDFSNSFLSKRPFDDFNDKMFIDNHAFTDEFTSYDKDFGNNQKIILKYVSRLCPLQKNIILNNIKNIHSLKYIFHSNQQMFNKEKGGKNLILEPKKFKPLININKSIIKEVDLNKNIKYMSPILIKNNIKDKLVQIIEHNNLKFNICKCQSLSKIFKTLLKIKTTPFNLIEQKEKLKKLLEDYLEVSKNPKPLYSNKLKRFLLLFFCMKSKEEDFVVLSKIERIFLFIILLK